MMKSQAKPEDTLDLCRFINDDLAATVNKLEHNNHKEIKCLNLPIAIPTTTLTCESLH